MNVSGDGADAGLILAGGRSRRMGGADKALVEIAGEPLAVRICRRLAPQVAAVAIAGAARAGFPPDPGVVWLDDGAFAGAGPLAGILAGLRWAGGRGTAHVVTVPVDVPFLPADLAARLAAGVGLAFAASAGGAHWTVGRWPVELADRLEVHLQATAERSVRGFAAGIGFRRVAFPVVAGAPDPFLNVNTPGDLRTAIRFTADEAGR